MQKSAHGSADQKNDSQKSCQYVYTVGFGSYNE